MSDLGLPGKDGAFGQRNAVDKDGAAGRPQKTHEKIDERALAGATLPNEADNGPFLHYQIDIRQHVRRMWRVTEAELLDMNLALELDRGPRSILEAVGNRLLKHLDDALKDRF